MQPDDIRRADAEIDAFVEIFDEPVRGAGSGPLSGLTFAVKDMFDVAGRVKRNGSLVYDARPATRTAYVVQQCLDAGATLVGMTRLTEYAYFQATTTRNPHDPRRTPGGSSSGSAAAVAAGMVDFAIGSQTKGSTIRPASFCGVAGFKPSYGRLSADGATALARTMDHTGLLARDLSVLVDVASTLLGAAPSSGRPRIAAIDLESNLPGTFDAPMAARYAETAETIGAMRIAPPIDIREAAEVWEQVFSPEAFDALAWLRGEPSYGRIGEIIREVIDTGARADRASYAAATRRRAELGRAWDRSTGWDVVLLPAAVGVAPLGLDYTGDPLPTAFTSLLGLPAACVPARTHDGLPLGMQLVGRYGADEAVLAAAARLDRVLSPGR